MDRSKTWLVLAALLLPAGALAAIGTTGPTAASRPDPAPVCQLAGTTVRSSKSNSSDRMAPPNAASATSTVKSGKSNSSDRMMAPPRAFGAAAGVDRPGPAPRSPAAANLDGSRSN